MCPFSISGFMCLKKNVSSSVLMCDPSTSASVIIIILWYFIFVMSSWSPIPIPIEDISAFISLFDSIFCSLDFSTFMTFPLSGSIAWYSLSLPCFAIPPAESPSTMYSSHSSGFVFEQSASFPGSDSPSSSPFLRVSSLAFFAASLAFAALMHFSISFFAILGFSSRNSDSSVFTNESTVPFISVFPSLVFVCPSNCGSGIFSDRTAVSPSFVSSLVIFMFPFSSLFFSA